ncbi:MAG: EI24 domain-containing protein [Pseudomonadota bacterium]|nr:EI24 domain-containing protein [Pseudomonadota bacterium]
MTYLKDKFNYYIPIFKNKRIIKIIIISFLLSFFLVALIFYYLWNLAPSFSWIHFIIGKFYYDLVGMFWQFIIFSFLIFLIPPLFSVVISFFLDDIIDETYLSLSKKKDLKLNNLSYLSGIYVGIKIFLYASMIFLFVIFLKLFFLSNSYLILLIQFLLSSYMICREYSNLICYKFSIRNPNFLINIKNGVICNILFGIPLIGIIAPVLTTIIISSSYIKDKNL